MTHHPRPFAHYLRSLYSWHRWIGVTASLLVLLLAATGLLLNNATAWQLDQRYACPAWLLAPYNLDLQAPTQGVRYADAYWTRYAGWLWRGSTALQAIDADAQLQQGQHGLWLLTGDGATALYEPQGKLLARGLRFNLPAGLAATTLQPLPADLVATLEQQAQCHQITWERWLLDLHAGRLFGPWGPYLMDAAAILFMLLAGTGLTLWLRQRRRMRRRREHSTPPD